MMKGPETLGKRLISGVHCLLWLCLVRVCPYVCVCLCMAYRRLWR